MPLWVPNQNLTINKNIHFLHKYGTKNITAFVLIFKLSTMLDDFSNIKDDLCIIDVKITSGGIFAQRNVSPSMGKWFSFHPQIFTQVTTFVSQPFNSFATLLGIGCIQNKVQLIFFSYFLF